MPLRAEALDRVRSPLRDPLARAALVGADLEPTTPPLWLPGVQFYFDADTIKGLADADPIPSWASTVGPIVAPQQITTKQPLYKASVLNGLPVVRFDGVDDELVWPTVLTLPGEFTIAAVHNISTAAGVVLGSGSGHRWAVNAAGQNDFRINSTFFATSSIATINAWMIHVATRDENGLVRTWINGVSGGAGVTNTSFWQISSIADSLGTIAAGDIRALLLTNRCATEAQRKTLEAYWSRQTAIVVTP